MTVQFSDTVVDHSKGGIFNHSVMGDTEKSEYHASEKRKNTGDYCQVDCQRCPAQGAMGKAPDEEVGDIVPDYT